MNAPRITKELLEASGYRAFPSSHDSPFCLGLWQKVLEGGEQSRWSKSRRNGRFVR